MSMSNRTPPEVLAKIEADYLRGDGSTAIAKRYGVCSATVLKSLRRAGVALRTNAEAMRLCAAARGASKRLLSREQERQVAALYVSGVAVEDIATQTGVRPSTVYKAVRRGGGMVRQGGVVTYSVNETVFDADPLGEEAAYFVGLMLTDGCVRFGDTPNAGCTVSLALCEMDRPIVERFAAFLGTDSPIGVNATKPGWQNVCRVTVTSTRLAVALARYGVVPNKTLTASAHEDLRGNRHFWRGCVDGDGWVMMPKRSDGDPTPQIGFCGTKRVVEQFEAYVQSVVPGIPGGRVRPNTGPNCWRVSYYCQNAIALARVLYGDCVVALPRKLEKAEAFFAIPDLYTVREVAELLSVHKGEVGSRGRSGAIPGGVLRPTGRLAGFDRDAISRFLAQRG